VRSAHPVHQLERERVACTSKQKVLACSMHSSFSQSVSMLDYYINSCLQTQGASATVTLRTASRATAARMAQQPWCAYASTALTVPTANTACRITGTDPGGEPPLSMPTSAKV